MTDPILVVGAGPTGLTAALELSRQGVGVRLIDKSSAPATTSRAIGVQARTLELLRQRGLVEEMLAKGNKGHWGSIYGGGKRAFHLDFGLVDSPYSYMLFISQADTEGILRDGCAKQGVKPEWGVELVAFSQDPASHQPSPVHAILRHADGRLEEVATPWLISADGAHSLARATLDVPYEGHTREEQYVLGDVRINGDLADTDLHIFSSEHGFMGLFPMGGDHFRLIASNPLYPPDKYSPPTLAHIQEIYDQRSHIPARFDDLIWSSWFRINSRMVNRLKVGRVLFGGDAAHIHSPAGAQGMNTGIQDMINVCWKLALVVKRGAPVALIDTYEKDRLPIMRGVLASTDKLTDMIGTENHFVRAAFNHIAPLVGGATPVQKKQTAGMSQVALGYRGSPLSEQHHHGGELHAGDRVPDLAVEVQSNGVWTPTSLLSLLDPTNFTLLEVADSRAETPPDAQGSPTFKRFATRAPRSDTEGAARLTQVLGKEAEILVRPDGYAALTTSHAEAAQRLEAYRAKWLTVHNGAASAGRASSGETLS